VLLFGACAVVLMGLSYWLIARHLRRTLPDDLASAALSELATQYALGVAGTLLLGAVVGWLVAGRVLSPLSAITRAARRMSDERLGERIDLPGPRDELRELADTIDDMLDRLAESFDTQREFIANASHELRSPLTVIRSQVEVALANPDIDPDELRTTAEAVLEAALRTEALLDGLMVLARSQRGLVTHDRLDLADVARSAARGASREAREARVGLRLDLRAAPAAGDRRLLERVVANLIENGIRHNAPGGFVHVATRPEAERTVLRVVSDGDHVDSGQADRLLEPFQRLDRASPRRGSGLGLSIVRSVAHAHGGDVRLAPRARGGLEVEVSLPVVAGAA
jgi:signal transduction histidine kinase